MSDRPLLPEFEKFFQPKKLGPDDETLVIPAVKANHITQEIRTGTQELPIVDQTVEQYVVPQPVQQYIPPTPRREPEHVSGERPGNGLLGMALCFIVGIIAMLALVDNVTIDDPKEDKPRTERSESVPPHRPTTASATPDWNPPVAPSKIVPSQAMPVRTTPASSASTSPTNRPVEVSPSLQINASAEPEISPTATASLPIEPPVTEEPPPTEEPSGQPTATPEQSSTPSTAVTP